MSSLSVAIKSINILISKTQKQKSRVRKKTVNFFKLTEIELELQQRLKLLTSYTKNIDQSTKEIETDVENKIEDLKGEMKERIASIRHEYEDNAAELPAIADVELVVESNTGSLLINTVEAIGTAVSQVYEQMLNVDVTSDAISKSADKMSKLVQHRRLVKSNMKDMEERIEAVKAEIDQKIENLDVEKNQRIASIHNDYEKKIAELPEIEDFTVFTVKKYMQQYLNEFTHIPKELNFFHAAASSNLEIVHFAEEDKYKMRIESCARQLSAKLPIKTYPLSLIDVDRLIHLFKDQRFAIFDTSLRVIMTNLMETLSLNYIPYLLIYDSKSQQFAPISWTTGEFINANFFCFTCMRYKWPIHPLYCRSRCCPICLRTGSDYRCFKPTPESRPFICITCHAFCQTIECFEAHRLICPLPVQRIHDDVFKLIKNIQR